MSALSSLLRPVSTVDPVRLPRSLRLGPLDRFDRWTLGMIAVVFLGLLVNVGNLRPSMSDTWYHLSVAERIVQDGEIPGWDWWHYAPIGRPNLYPPLLHIILAFLAQFTGSIVAAGQVCAVSSLPLGLLATWYCARRIADSRVALLATVVLMADMFHFVVMQAYIAGCLTNILMPVLLVTFLSRRAWWSILLMSLMYYSHLGFPHCVALGLIVFGLKYPSYLRLALKVVGISLIFYTPWLSHVLGHLDWLAVARHGGVPGSLLEKVLSLQAFNLVLLGLGIWGISVAPRSSPVRMLPVYMLIGFLPILFSYGGRYTMHTMPIWGILCGGILRPLLPVASGSRRVLGIVMLSLLPLPSVGLFGGIMPIPLTGSHLLIISALRGQPGLGDDGGGEAYLADCDELVAWLRANTGPREIVYTNKVWIADLISVLADRPTDFGAWWECSKESAKLYSRALRDWAPEAVFVCIKPDADGGSILGPTVAMPGVDERISIGRFDIGVRRLGRVRHTGKTVSGWQALSAAGAAGSAESSAGLVAWRFQERDGNLALISARVPAGDWSGLGLCIKSSAMTGDLVLGVRDASGHDYRWPLSVPDPDTWYNVRAVFRWMTDAQGNQWEGGVVREAYLAHPASERRRGKQEHKGEKDSGEKEKMGMVVEISHVELLRLTPPGSSGGIGRAK